MRGRSKVESRSNVSPRRLDSTSYAALIQAAIPKLLILAKLLLSPAMDFSFRTIILGFPPQEIVVDLAEKWCCDFGANLQLFFCCDSILHWDQ